MQLELPHHAMGIDVGLIELVLFHSPCYLSLCIVMVIVFYYVVLMIICLFFLFSFFFCVCVCVQTIYQGHIQNEIRGVAKNVN